MTAYALVPVLEEKARDAGSPQCVGSSQAKNALDTEFRIRISAPASA